MDTKQYWNQSAKDLPADKSHSNYAVEKEKSFPGNANVLDLGGGSGQDSLYFASKGHHIMLVDISDVAIDKFIETANKKGLHFHAGQLDLADGIIPFEDDSFDVVYSRLALHYFSPETTKKLFKEIERILAKGGVAYITLKSPEDETTMEFFKKSAKELSTNFFEDNGITKSRYSLDQLKQFLKESGVKKYEVKEIDEDLSTGRVDKIKSGSKAFLLNEVTIEK